MRILCIVGSVLVLLVLAAAYDLAHSQRGANFLVDPDQPVSADLIYVLGGNYSVRAPEAARLFREGRAPRILLAREPTDLSSHQENFTDATVRLLVEAGVPHVDIVQMNPASGVRSTADEARVLSLYLRTYPARKILIVTSPLHTRRARMAIKRAIPRDTQVFLIAAPGDCTNWTWQSSPSCRQQVAFEWLKLYYYFFTFWP